MNLVVPYKTPTGAGTGDMLKANNLGDVNNPGTARANLGVPSAAESEARLARWVGGVRTAGLNSAQIGGNYPAFGTEDYSLVLGFMLERALPPRTRSGWPIRGRTSSSSAWMPTGISSSAPPPRWT